MERYFRGKCLDKWGSQFSKRLREEKEDLKSGKTVKVEWFKRMFCLSSILSLPSVIRRLAYAFWFYFLTF